ATTNPGLAPCSYTSRAGRHRNRTSFPTTRSSDLFTVDKSPLGINTTVHTDDPDQPLVGNLPLNGAVHDSASVTGKINGFALPDVTFYFFADGVACKNGDTTGATALNTVTPDSSGLAHPSTSKTRSEERRVGLEGGSGGAREHYRRNSECEAIP